MKRSDRLKAVLKLSVMREEDALRGLGFAQQQLFSEQQRLQEVNTYQIEYIESFHQKAQQGINGFTAQNYRLFIEKLSSAIKQQQQQVIHVEQAVDRAREHWQLMHAKCKAMEALIDRYRHEELLVLGKKEQKEADERSQQRLNQLKISGNIPHAL